MISATLDKIGELLDFSSVTGIIVLLLLILLVITIIRKLWHPMMIILGVLVILEIGYVLGQSALNAYIPLSTIFSTDIFGDIAHLFSGTIVGNLFENISLILCRAGDGLADIVTNIMGALDLI